MSGKAVDAAHKLMRQMGARSFDPMPPDQHGFLIRNEEPMLNRAIAWIWSKTIHPGPGHRRSPFAKDRRGDLTHVEMAHDLGWQPSRAKGILQQLVNQGRVRRDEEGRLWLCGTVPESDGRTEGEEGTYEYCTVFLNPELAEYIQRLPKTESVQREGEWRELQLFKKQVLADAIAIGREQADAVENQWYQRIGFTPEPERRGRPAKAREKPLVQLALLELPNCVHNSGPNSVQNGNGDLYRTENGSVQNPQPYRTENESFRVSEWPAAEQEQDTHPPEKPTPPADEEITLAALHERGFPVKRDDRLLRKFVALAAEHAIPIRSLARAIQDKAQQKGDRVWNAGALYAFVREYLPTWIRQHSREIALDQREQKAPEASASRYTLAEQIASEEAFLAELPDHSGAAAARRNLERLSAEQAQQNGSERAQKAGQG